LRTLIDAQCSNPTQPLKDDTTSRYPLTNDTIDHIPANSSREQKIQDPWVAAYDALPNKIRDECVNILLRSTEVVNDGSMVRLAEIVDRQLARHQERRLKYSVSIIPPWVTEKIRML
jgi:hypothetical protein